VKRFARHTLVTLLSLFLLILAGTGGGLLWLRSSLPQVDGMVRLGSPDAPAEIIRDANAVPHIFAESVRDGYFALGYVHAQDRLWQMELMRRFGAGRLSEVFGKATVPRDRYARILGLYRLAEEQVRAADDKAREALEAYAEGVNAYLENRGLSALPPEFAMLRFTPEPWRPADSLVWSRIMAMRLAKNWYDELLRLQLAEKLPAERIEELWPDDPPDSPLTLPPPEQSAALRPGPLLAAIPKAFRPVDASNAWVVEGARTASGEPILANDPHLGFRAPILWYLVRIVTPTQTLVGATVPGVPLLILGHNGHIAWGMTTTGADTQDLYLEKTDPADPALYMTPQGAEPFGNRTELIRVRDADPVAQIVRTSRHGPIITDMLRGPGAAVVGARPIALATPALRADDRTPWALFGINRARNWNDFIAASRDFHAPYQNLFFADVTGDIGFIAAGRLPKRRSGDGRVPVDGSDAGNDWDGFVPFEELPQGFNPLSGLFANANNRLTGPSYRHLITRDWDSPYRAERIFEVLRKRDELTIIDNERLQMDTLSTAARRLMPILLTLKPNTKLEEQALNRLRIWDLRMAREAPEPLIYSGWLRHLSCELIREKMAPEPGDCLTPRPRFVANALTHATHWCDNLTTTRVETCETPLRNAFRRALHEITERFGRDMTNWRWGSVHRARFKHPLFTRVPLLDRLGDRTIETDGGNDTLNRGQSYADASGRLTHVHGAGYRAVYDLADLANSRFMIATGQSGNPLSPRYDDMLTRWRDGVYIRIAGDREALRRRAQGILILKKHPPGPRPKPGWAADTHGTDATP
jgi:penicillin amidase